MRYIVVNERVPRGLDRYCAYCCKAIHEGYVRDLTGTRIIYDEPKCWELHVMESELGIEDAARRIS